jgi:hypothetical protein
MSKLSITELLFARVEELKRESYNELSKLPSHQEQNISCSNGYATMSIWKDTLGNDKLRIVVQVYQSSALVLGRMQAAGFRATRYGVEELQTGELDEFN